MANETVKREQTVEVSVVRCDGCGATARRNENFVARTFSLLRTPGVEDRHYCPVCIGTLASRRNITGTDTAAAALAPETEAERESEEEDEEEAELERQLAEEAKLDEENRARP